MRTYFICAVLCFCSLLVFSQPLELRKASPFTAVKWENEQPIVEFENEWYQFEKLDHLSKKIILNFCKKEYGHKWQKRFSEDLVEVLGALGHKPTISVRLVLSKTGVSKDYRGAFTAENRRRSLAYNQKQNALKRSSTLSRKLTPVQALADIRQFEEILTNRSSYARLSNFDYQQAIQKLVDGLPNGTSMIDINLLTNRLAKIMSGIGDRHASVKNEALDIRDHAFYSLRLPFGLATIDGKIAAIQRNTKDANYSYYDSRYPWIKSIDGVVIDTLMNTYNYRDQKAPLQAKLSRGSTAIEKYGELLYKNNRICTDSVKIVLTDGKADKEEMVVLTTERKGYTSKLLLDHYNHGDEIERHKNFKNLTQILPTNIGYINLPRMYHYDEVQGLEAYIESALDAMSTTKALIIDIRNNPGGGREILQTFAHYIVQPDQSPWIANIAYLRTDKKPIDDATSMNSRYLFRYHSNLLKDTDRVAIDKFNTSFELKKRFDTSKFSAPFYMVLHSGKKTYSKPVYLLVNERSFSAATVFASAFKGLSNVQIAGVTTDGSSGNSKVLHLRYSNIRLKIATMLSFQRNGKTLDGHGTIPDIGMPTDEKQVLEGQDTQLNTLIEHINKDD